MVTKFDMKSVETSQYENMQNSGNMTLTGFKYVDETNKAMNIKKAVVQFTNTRINLQELDFGTVLSEYIPFAKPATVKSPVVFTSFKFPA